ncbi:UPAR/Ly6 domain-containing protein qvr-like [Haematobia irritans]|uniref:UPAR/Ly6 domain-containing protein qvr-like n=1 Tax=Haematobia irritans TaxID=7368 RepID=UPI003F4F4246
MNFLWKEFLIIFLIVSPNIEGVSSLICYYCNSYGYLDCGDIDRSANNTELRICSSVCYTKKFKFRDYYVFGRGCGTTWDCDQRNGMCCYCKEDFCNYGNDCYSHSYHLHLSQTLFICILSLNLI